MDNRVSAVGCGEYESAQVRSALRRLIENIDGFGWVKAGMTVAVKVNLVSAHAPEKAVTPHPVLVCEICRMLMERGARVVLGDSPGGPYNRAFLEGVYRKTGMYAAARESGAELNTDFSVVQAEIPDGVCVKKFSCTEYLLKADAIVDVCKLKTHALTAYTGACKNMFGGVAGMEKAQFHCTYPSHEQFGNAMVDLCQFFKPKVCIMDGIVGMEGNGPSSGEPRKVGLLLSSKNPHALDLCAAHVIGLGATDVPTLKSAVERSLCPGSIEGVEVIGDELESFAVKDYVLQPKTSVGVFPLKSKLLSDLLLKLVSSRPVPDEGCTGCGKCMEYCPANAITIKNRRASVDRKKCISCFCCGEFCPFGAMKPKIRPIAKLLGRGGQHGV